jgi:RibD C-terminal domain
MAKLIYSTITSLDGYVADRDGDFDWAAPDKEVHAFVNDLERKVGAYLWGPLEPVECWQTQRVLRKNEIRPNLMVVTRATYGLLVRRDSPRGIIRS